MAYSQAVIDFYNNQVLKENSLWRKYTGARSIQGQRTKEYTKAWDQLKTWERSNIKDAYQTFKKNLPVH